MTSAQQDHEPSVIERLAAYAGPESFETLPDTVVRAARCAILDPVGLAQFADERVRRPDVQALIPRVAWDGQAAAISHGRVQQVHEHATEVMHV